MGWAGGWSWAGQGTLGSPDTPSDCDKNKMVCDQEMMGLLPGKTGNPTLTEKQQPLTGFGRLGAAEMGILQLESSTPTSSPAT